MTRTALTLLAALPIAACTTPPAPPQPRTATPVQASFGKTWDAVIDVFAADNIPIRTMERASGFISTDRFSASRADTTYADCGKLARVPFPPTDAIYNVVVRGDSSSSTVRTTVSWRRVHDDKTASSIECTSKGSWESAFERAVKVHAEGKPGAQ